MINVALGVKEYHIQGVNGEYILRINPTDDDFAEVLSNLVESCDKVEETYGKMITEENDGVEIWKNSKARNKELRDLIDGVLGDKFCETVYGHISLHAGDGDGLPLWLSLIFSIFDEMSEEIDREKSAMKPRLEKYIGKYKRK